MQKKPTKRKKKIENKETVSFIRMRDTLEDIVAYVVEDEEYITIRNPIRIDIETFFGEGRQIIHIQDYLPQSVIELKEIRIPREDILFCTQVKEQFEQQFKQTETFFYNNQSELKTKGRFNTESGNTTQKVVSILEAMTNKKDKPIH